ncbi:MAG: class I tRNA ligase family protein, partial [Thiohalobacterales bacterium]|nr:class I tRNA ligase family protein [Thiohalobacterales bacterium]
TVRLFTMFAAPPDQSLEWSDTGVEGASRFLKRLWKQVHAHVNAGPAGKPDIEALDAGQRALRNSVHAALAKVGDDIGRRYTFNTAIAANMELMNELARFGDESGQGRAVMQEALEMIVLMLAPIVPHITHTLWHALGHADAVVDCAWPEVDQSALVQESVTLVVQVNGKVRGRVDVPADAAREAIESAVMAEGNVQRHMEGKTAKKVIVVPGKLVNIVV